MKHQRAFIGMVLIVTISMLLASCGASQTAATSTPAPAPTDAATEAPTTMSSEAPAAPTEVTAATAEEVAEIGFFHPRLSPESDAWMEGIVAAFNEGNQGKIHVTFSGVDEETYKTKLPMDLRSSEPPDVYFNYEGGKTRMMVDSGFAEPLDRYYEQYGWGDQLPASVSTLATFDGKKYFIGTNIGTMVMYYRPSVFEAYGLSVPETWEELLANAEVLKQNSVTPMLLSNQMKWPAQFYWEALLVNSHGVDTLQALFDDKIPWTDERVVDAFATLKELVDKGYFEASPNSMDIAVAEVPFRQGQAAMWLEGSWMLKYFKDDNNGLSYDVEFFAVPPLEGKDQVMQVFVEWTLAMHPASQHKDESAVFMDFMLSPEVQNALGAKGFGLPASVNADLSAMHPFQQKVAKAAAMSGPYTYMPVDHGVVPAISDGFLDNLQAVIAGAMTPQEAAEATEATAVAERGPIQAQ